MTPKVKCPWCKSEPVSEDQESDGWFIGCMDSDCDVKPSCWGEDQEDALEIWNKAGIE